MQCNSPQSNTLFTFSSKQACMCVSCSCPPTCADFVEMFSIVLLLLFNVKRAKRKLTKKLSQAQCMSNYLHTSCSGGSAVHVKPLSTLYLLFYDDAARTPCLFVLLFMLLLFIHMYLYMHTYKYI